MRVIAFRSVGDADAFCSALQAGSQFNKLKDSSGAKLTDAYLRKRLSEDHGWIDLVYQQTSDFIHLSSRHLDASIYSTDDETRTVRFAITGNDLPHPEHAYFEIVDVFFDATKLVGTLLSGLQIALATNRK